MQGSVNDIFWCLVTHILLYVLPVACVFILLSVLSSTELQSSCTSWSVVVKLLISSVVLHSATTVCVSYSVVPLTLSFISLSLSLSSISLSPSCVNMLLLAKLIIITTSSPEKRLR